MVSKGLTRHKSHRLSIFNHKGGVGKTTLTVNIAASLAGLGKKILLVDSDPQCNLTTYLIEASVVDDLLDNSDKRNGATLWSAVKPVVEGVGSILPIKPIESNINNIFLLPGDIRFSEFELELSHMWNECFQRRLRGFTGTAALSLLVNSIADEYKIDYVFYDSGPNIGPLNRVVLLDCDYFIVPASCDQFSIRAFKTLGHTLARWIRDWKTIVELAPDDVYLLPGKPKFLGYIPQRFRVYGGEITADFAEFLPQIEKHIHSDIVAVLRELDPNLASTSLSYRLGQIKDFSSLASLSQTQGVPIKSVHSNKSDLKESADKAFLAIAKKIIQRTA